MKKGLLIFLITTLLISSSISIPAISNEKQEAQQLDIQNNKTFLNITIETIKEKFLHSLNTIKSDHLKREYEQFINQKFSQIQALGINKNTTLDELLLQNTNNPMIHYRDVFNHEQDKEKMWRFPLLSLLFKMMHLNFLCDMTVDMNVGWISITNTSLPSDYDIVLIRRAAVSSENVLTNPTPGENFIEKLINWIINKGVNKIINPYQYGTRRMTLILGSSSAGIIDDPDFFLPDDGPINDFLVKLAKNFGLQSYELNTDAFFTISI
jgi:hypothetical protein